ncbi:Hypothetical predicted protein [Octopus vulgaris]|uniref:Uncharacterized protein n=1 Tax=Octopus vulgaris TaxID=6645 RepID=A0AA36F5V3_OCTVU|nr:Hypothetical predicted protein [Octopus vulgaris]
MSSTATAAEQQLKPTMSPNTSSVDEEQQKLKLPVSSSPVILQQQQKLTIPAEEHLLTLLNTDKNRPSVQRLRPNIVCMTGKEKIKKKMEEYQWCDRGKIRYAVIGKGRMDEFMEMCEGEDWERTSLIDVKVVKSISSLPISVNTTEFGRERHYKTGIC